jgi:hypothetical protein
MEIAKGWSFTGADFSCKANGMRSTGSVTLIREKISRELWHKQPDELIDSDDCPELYIIGVGTTFERAVVDANNKANHAKEITVQEETE